MNTVAEVFQSQSPRSERHKPTSRYPHGVVVHHGEEWTVESIVEDGDIETTVFLNYSPRERAIAYAESRYDEVRIKELASA